MTRHEQELIRQMAAVMEQFQRRCDQTGQELRQVVQQVPAAVLRATDEQVRRLPGEVMDRVRGGIEQPVTAYEARLREASEQLLRSSHALTTQLQRAEALHKQLIWKVLGVTLGSLLLLLAGGGWLSTKYYDEIRQNQISADLLKAYNQADVTLCGDRLCAKVDRKDKRYGDYIPVKPR